MFIILIAVIVSQYMNISKLIKFDTLYTIYVSIILKVVKKEEI